MMNTINVKYLTSLLAILLLLPVSVNAEEYEGTLQWSKRVELSTPVNGVVEEVFAQPGMSVPRGDVLVQLDPRSFKADLKFANAQLKAASMRHKEAKRELDRQTDMYDRTMLSEHDLQVAKNNATAARSEYIQAQSSLTRAKLNLEYSAIRAPFNAVVIRSLAVKGQVVASDVTPPILVVVAEAQRMQARFYVTAEKTRQLSLKQGVKVKVAGKTYTGKIQAIALEPEQSKNEKYAVDAIFATEEKLRAGQKATISL